MGKKIKININKVNFFLKFQTLKSPTEVRLNIKCLFTVFYKERDNMQFHNNDEVTRISLKCRRSSFDSKNICGVVAVLPFVYKNCQSKGGPFKRGEQQAVSRLRAGEVIFDWLGSWLTWIQFLIFCFPWTFCAMGNITHHLHLSIPLASYNVNPDSCLSALITVCLQEKMQAKGTLFGNADVGRNILYGGWIIRLLPLTVLHNKGSLFTTFITGQKPCEDSTAHPAGRTDQSHDQHFILTFTYTID